MTFVKLLDKCLDAVLFWTSLVARCLKSLTAMQDTWVRSLGWEDPLEKEMATHASILSWRIPWTRGAWQATVYGVARVRVQHN